jgi:hypothetical protein
MTSKRLDIRASLVVIAKRAVTPAEELHRKGSMDCSRFRSLGDDKVGVKTGVWAFEPPAPESAGDSNLFWLASLSALWR